MSPDRALALGLTQPWLLARVAGSALAALATGAALLTCARRPAEHRAALLRAAIHAASTALGLSLTLAVLSASRLAQAVPGAMCAAGVFSASPWGASSLWCALVASLAAAGARGVAAVDGRLLRARIDLALALGVVTVTVLSVVDVVASLAFIATLDLDESVTCCGGGASTALPGWFLLGPARACAACAAARWPWGVLATLGALLLAHALATGAAVRATGRCYRGEAEVASRPVLQRAAVMGVGSALLTAVALWRSAVR